MPHFKHIPHVTMGGSTADATPEAQSTPADERYGLKGKTYEEQMASLLPPVRPPAPQPQAPEAEEEGGWGLMDTVHAGLDLAGLVPAFGEVADGVNSLLYLAEGDKGNAALSAAAMIPFAGWAATGAKGVKTSMKVADNVNTANRVTRQVAGEGLTKAGGRVATSLPRPKGLPDNWVGTASKKGGGTKYAAPDNPHHSVRVMPGNPKSPHPNSRQPYVRHMKDGKALDARGKVVDVNTPEAHISLDQFVWPF